MDRSDVPSSATGNFAFFGPSDKHFVPAGGFCISVFVIVRKKMGILLVKPRQDPRWQEWAPNWRVYESARLTAEMGKWRIPSTYVEEGEAPEDGLRRVMEDQLGVRQYSASPSVLLNFYEASRRYRKDALGLLLRLRGLDGGGGAREALAGRSKVRRPFQRQTRAWKLARRHTQKSRFGLKGAITAAS